MTLVGRQRDALNALERFGAAGLSAAERAWTTVLRLRNTEDWRLLPELEHATLLETRMDGGERGCRHAAAAVAASGSIVRAHRGQVRVAAARGSTFDTVVPAGILDRILPATTPQ